MLYLFVRKPRTRIGLITSHALWFFESAPDHVDAPRHHGRRMPWSLEGEGSLRNELPFPSKWHAHVWCMTTCRWFRWHFIKKEKPSLDWNYISTPWTVSKKKWNYARQGKAWSYVNNVRPWRRTMTHFWTRKPTRKEIMLPHAEEIMIPYAEEIRCKRQKMRRQYSRERQRGLLQVGTITRVC